MSTAIEFNNISKQYRLGLVSTKTLSHDIDRWWKVNVMRKEDPYLKIGSVNDRSTAADSEYVWALKDIDFKVEQGDVVGIIGKNGAGKSTLLKLLSKVTAPTTGVIRARGRIGALLEVGTGFHPEMTGRENIYMNGAIMGMSKQEISRKLDEIVDFSGCERYIDTPVKRYSSGMTVRLGFAVAAHLDPEILVVDEVLAVGDAEFQKKAIGKMQDVSQGEGRTVLFVSHILPSIKALCKHGIVLDKGQIYYSGTAEEAIDEYLGMDNQSLQDNARYHTRIFNKCISINRVLINGCEQYSWEYSNNSRKVSVRIEGTSDILMNIAVELHVHDQNGSHVGTYTPAEWEGRQSLNCSGRFVIEEEMELPGTLCNGTYVLSARLYQIYVEHLATIDNMARITISQFSSPTTGAQFNNGYFGSMMFHDVE